MTLASLVPFQGPKKSRFSGPTPSNAPRNDVAPLKIITYRTIKTTSTLIVSIIHTRNNILLSTFLSIFFYFTMSLLFNFFKFLNLCYFNFSDRHTIETLFFCVPSPFFLPLISFFWRFLASPRCCTVYLLLFFCDPFCSAVNARKRNAASERFRDLANTQILCCAFIIFIWGCKNAQKRPVNSFCCLFQPANGWLYIH